MSKPRVLNTRPREQAGAFSEALRERGLEPVEAPAVEVVPAWSEADATCVLRRLRARDYDWVVFASANAVRYGLKALQAVGGGSDALGSCRVICGTATGAALRRAELMPTLVLERFSAASALAALAGETIQNAVLVPRAQEGRDELIEGLRQRGVEVDAPVVYRTAPVAPRTLQDAARRLRAGEVAAVTFASPSAVRGFVEGLRALGEDPAGLLRPCTIGCIGATTAGEAARQGLRVRVIAPEPSAASLAEALVTFLTGVPARREATAR